MNIHQQVARFMRASLSSLGGALQIDGNLWANFDHFPGKSCGSWWASKQMSRILRKFCLRTAGQMAEGICCPSIWQFCWGSFMRNIGSHRIRGLVAASFGQTQLWHLLITLSREAPTPRTTSKRFRRLHPAHWQYWNIQETKENCDMLMHFLSALGLSSPKLGSMAMLQEDTNKLGHVMYILFCIYYLYHKSYKITILYSIK